MSELARHWQDRLTPMDGPRWPIRCGHAFSAAQLARLREGLWPQDMDDRWAVWLEGDTLRCWRSWTGTCVYEAQVLVDDDGTGVATMLDVLDAPEHYHRSASDAGELDRFEGVVGLALTAPASNDARY